MTIRFGTISDVPKLAPLYAKGNASVSLSAAQQALAQIVGQTEPSHQLLLSESSAGELLGFAASGPDPEGYQGAALHLLSVTPNAFGRRLVADLLKALQLQLVARRIPCLWIRCEVSAVSSFVQNGAIPIANCPPARGSAARRQLLRLVTALTADELESSRLILRNWTSSDVQAFREINADERVNEWLPGPLSPDESDYLADRINQDLVRCGFGYWAVQRKLPAPKMAAEKFMGFVGLAPLVDIPVLQKHLRQPALEIAWRLHPTFWNQNFATEAAQLSIRYAFEQLHTKELIAFTVAGNLASQRVMKKLGMKRDPAGDFEHPGLPAGHRLKPHLLYRLSKMP